MWSGSPRARHCVPHLVGRVVLLGCALVACDAVEQLPGFEEPLPPHASYFRALEQAGLHETALGREWLLAARASLQNPVRVTLPVQEAGYIAAEHPRAVAYQVQLVRGRRLSLSVELAPHAGAHVFVDVFEVSESDDNGLRHVAAADSGMRQLEFEPERTGDYVIRLQPELLRGGRYVLTLREQAALSFPVHGRSSGAILSGFGAPRDGGVRDHHGIDIFAPRGTPALAAAEAVVSRVSETPRGGRVVWLRDERRGNRMYYAHLDQQLVDPGERVQAGDTIGLIGNTGNARTTAPHLHFGIYRRGEGPLDPRPWVARINARAERPGSDTLLLGKWARLRRATALRAAPNAEANELRTLPVETVMRVVGVQSAWLLVLLPDRTAGYLNRAAVAAATPATVRVGARAELRDRPAPHAAVIDTVSGELPAYGRFEEFLLVRHDSVFGWIIR